MYNLNSRAGQHPRIRSRKVGAFTYRRHVFVSMRMRISAACRCGMLAARLSRAPHLRTARMRKVHAYLTTRSPLYMSAPTPRRNILIEGKSTRRKTPNTTRITPILRLHSFTFIRAHLTNTLADLPAGVASIDVCSAAALSSASCYFSNAFTMPPSHRTGTCISLSRL